MSTDDCLIQIFHEPSLLKFPCTILLLFLVLRSPLLPSRRLPNCPSLDLSPVSLLQIFPSPPPLHANPLPPQVPLYPNKQSANSHDVRLVRVPGGNNEAWRLNEHLDKPRRQRQPAGGRKLTLVKSKDRAGTTFDRDVQKIIPSNKEMTQPSPTDVTVTQNWSLSPRITRVTFEAVMFALAAAFILSLILFFIRCSININRRNNRRRRQFAQIERLNSKCTCRAPSDPDDRASETSSIESTGETWKKRLDSMTKSEVFCFITEMRETQT